MLFDIWGWNVSDEIGGKQISWKYFENNYY